MSDFPKTLEISKKINSLYLVKNNYAGTKRFIEGIVIRICVADARKHVFPSLDKPEGPFVSFSVDSMFSIIK